MDSLIETLLFLLAEKLHKKHSHQIGSVVLAQGAALWDPWSQGLLTVIITLPHKLCLILE